MAAPGRPGISEARVPCPLCGGLIHPVAGRCKHCKEDLTSFRAGRPQAAAVLPALLGNGKSNGHAAAPIALPATEASQPILPPRESMSMAAAHDRPSTWRRWPVIVMILAAVAIVGAVVVMVWLPPSKSEGARALPPPPAPERMETNPLPPDQLDQHKKADDDPWGPPPGAPHAQAQPRHAPDPVPDLQDPFASPHGTATDPLAQAFAGTNADFIAQFGTHVCDRLAACGMGQDQMLRTYCSMMRQAATGGAPSCDAARRCFQHIDQLSCSAQANDPTAIASLMTQIPDCLDAFRC